MSLIFCVGPTPVYFLWACASFSIKAFILNIRNTKMATCDSHCNDGSPYHRIANPHIYFPP